jgi:hypothetical protein
LGRGPGLRLLGLVLSLPSFLPPGFGLPPMITPVQGQRYTVSTRVCAGCSGTGVCGMFRNKRNGATPGELGRGSRYTV